MLLVVIVKFKILNIHIYDKLPKMSPKIMKGNTLMIEPLTIAFVVFPEAKVKVCNIVV